MFESFILNGFITMASKDSGDSLQKTTFLGVLEKRSGQYIPGHEDIVSIVSKAEVKPGILVRHPTPAAPERSWMANPETTSRDQISSYIIWCGYEGQRSAITRQLKEQVKRFGFYQNKLPIWPSAEELANPKPWWKVDFWSPEHVFQYIRAYNMTKRLPWPLHTLAWIMSNVTDLWMLGNVLIIMGMGYLDADFSDDDTAVLSMIQAKDSLDSLFSKLSRFIYRYRPVAGYTDESKTVTLRSLGKAIPGSAILWKHRKPDAPPLGEFLIQTKVLENF